MVWALSLSTHKFKVEVRKLKGNYIVIPEDLTICTAACSACPPAPAQPACLGQSKESEAAADPLIPCCHATMLPCHNLYRQMPMPGRLGDEA